MRASVGAAVAALLVVPASVAAQGQLASATRTPLSADRGSAHVMNGVAVRAMRAPVIDGRGDDEAWRAAPPITGFKVFLPEAHDEAAGFSTEARVLFDDRYLYVLVQMRDPHPDSIVALLSRRDVGTESDAAWVLIDSYHDRRTGYEFAVNPAGVQRDLYTYGDGAEDDAWDAVWDSATRIDSTGWTAEFRIPFGQLRFAKGDSHVFGVMIIRDIARRRERVSWPYLDRNKSGFASQFGEISGLTGIPSPKRLEVKPYVVAKNVSRDVSLDASGTRFSRVQQVTGGADLKYGLTSNLTLDATVNPDFGQVEADPSQLNLSAFETFFQERRPFFLEGTGIFRFDVSCNDGTCNGLFYSRRIGRDPQLRDTYGDPASATSTRILGAAKMTGRIGAGTSIGVLDAVTERVPGPAADGFAATTLEPRTNYAVARLQQDFFDGKSGVGVMLTGVNRELDPTSASLLRREAYTGGVDFRHRFAADGWEVTGFLAGSRVAGTPEAIAETQLGSAHYYQRPDAGLRFDPTRTSLAGDAELLSLNKVSGLVRLNVNYQRLSPGFEINDIGFNPVSDVQNASAWLQLRINEPALVFRQAFLNVNHWQSWTTGGLRTGLGGNINAHAEFSNSWWGHFGVGVNNLDGSYCALCSRGGPALLQTASWFTFAGVESNSRKQVSGNLWFNGSTADGGRSPNWNVNGNAVLRVSSRFSVSAGPSYTRAVSDAQWKDNPIVLTAAGALLRPDTLYTFARLDQSTLSLTTRLNFTATPTLSLQVYASPFVSTGTYSNWRRLGDARASSYDARFAPYTEGGDPGGFDYKQLRSNTVVRWEYRPGSTLFVVWTQGRDANADVATPFHPRRQLDELFSARPNNTVLVKMSYWVNY